MIGRSKLAALISLIAVAVILGTLMLTASANDEDILATGETERVNLSF